MNAPALSDSQIYDKMDHKVNIMTYSELHKFKNIDEVLGPYRRACLLLSSKPNYGHWVCLFVNPKDKKLYFFNSYGDLEGQYAGYPDYYLTYVDKQFRDKSFQDKPYLSNLLVNSKYELDYNPVDYQKMGKNIKTCGYHCIVRMMHGDLTDNQYKQFIDSNCRNMRCDPDDFVVMLTECI